MKSIILNSSGLENVTVEEYTKPQFKANEVLVHIKAFSLNYVDLMLARGDFPIPYPYPLGCDAAGVVEAVGDEITLFKKGDIVSTHFMREWEAGPIKESYTTFEARTLGGAFTEYIIVTEKGIVKAPANLTFEEIASVPIAGISAWQGLFNVGNLIQGNTVLLQGTGGVSIFGLQFAKAAGASVIITSSSDEKLEKAKALGADYTINYKNNPEWQQQVLDYTNGEGVDVALEIVGTELAKTAQAVKVGGSIALIGLVGGIKAELNIIGLLQRPIKIEVVEGGSRQTFYQMNRSIEQNNIKPLIDKVFDYAQINQALAYAAAGQHFGKVVIKF
jgi:NADPH:quinone reductase-like Zn-dependent oxidoreductase